MVTWPIPDGLDAAPAACVPVAFGTAQECLFTAGNLAEGQTVLIHAGAGGVGMAAIQLAKQAGATVSHIVLPAGYDPRVTGIAAFDGTYIGIEFKPLETTPAPKGIADFKAAMVGRTLLLEYGN